jgi:hypothetical protein
MKLIAGYESSWMTRQLREPNYAILSNSKIKNNYNFAFHNPICCCAYVQGPEKFAPLFFDSDTTFN